MIQLASKRSLGEKLKDKMKWDNINKPLTVRLEKFKYEKKLKESVKYIFDYDMPFKGYGLDNIYKCSIILRRDLDSGRLLWSVIDRQWSRCPLSTTYWEYYFNRKFVERILLLPTAEDEELWYVDVGRGIGIPKKIVRRTVREMKEVCKKDNILILED